MLKGTARGLTGLIVKPVAGVLDASAKTAESVSNTATHFDDKPNENRLRIPRAFYDRSRYIKYYKLDDSALMLYL